MVVVRCCCYCPLLVVAERVRGTHAVRAPLLLPKNARELCLVGSDARFSELVPAEVGRRVPACHPLELELHLPCGRGQLSFPVVTPQSP